MSSFSTRASVRLLEWMYRLTRGRFGLEPGMVDLDGVSLSFSLDLVLNPIGWSCGSAHRFGGIRIIEVGQIDGDVAADRGDVVRSIQQVVRANDRFAGRHRVVFPGGLEVDLV